MINYMYFILFFRIHIFMFYFFFQQIQTQNQEDSSSDDEEPGAVAGGNMGNTWKKKNVIEKSP